MAEGPTIFTRREVNRVLLAAAVACAAAPPVRLAGAPVRLFDFAVAGGYHHGLSEARPELRPGMALLPMREPGNPHDSAAVASAAVAVHRADGLRLGYIPRAANTPIAVLMDSGGRCARKSSGC